MAQGFSSLLVAAVVQGEFLFELVASLGVGCDGVLDVLESVSDVFSVLRRKGAYVESFGQDLACVVFVVFIACQAWKNRRRFMKLRPG